MDIPRLQTGYKHRIMRQECFIASIVGSCLSHFVKCRALSLLNKQNPLLFQAGNYWRTGIRPSARTSLHACITSTFDCNYAFFSFLAFLFPHSPKSIELQNTRKIGESARIFKGKLLQVSCKWNNRVEGGL